MSPFFKVFGLLLCGAALVACVPGSCFASKEPAGKPEGKKEAKSESKKEEGKKEAGKEKEGKKEAREAAEIELPPPGPDEIRGIELGRFKIRSDYPAEAQKSTVQFTIYLSVKGDRLAATTTLVEEHRQKLRDEVIIATRLTPLAVFEEPDLKTFRRRVLMRLHRTLPQLAVEELYVTDFSLLVKSL